VFNDTTTKTFAFCPPLRARSSCRMARSQASPRPNSCTACTLYLPWVLSLRLPSNAISCASSWSNFCQCKSQGKRSLEDLLYSNASPGLFSQDLSLITLYRPESMGLVCASIYVLSLTLFIPFVFSYTILRFTPGSQRHEGLDVIEFPHYQVRRLEFCLTCHC
jgi:hypothetical protein